MKIIARLYLILFFSTSLLAQSDPTVSTLMQYEQTPIDLSNGLPQVSVPFINLPTRSKDIKFDIELKYHPLNSIVGNEVSSNCGIGWNLFAGGVISRILIGPNDAIGFDSSTNLTNTGDDIYQFNFMGYFGRFILTKKPDGSLGLKVLKQKDSNLSIKIERDSHYEVTKFTFYDEKGYQFVFDVINRNNNYNSAYYLSSIVDNNNKELVHVNYQVVSYPDTYGANGFVAGYIFNQVKEINSIGNGKVTLNYSTSGKNAKLSELILTDAYGTGIKKMKLFGTLGRISKIQLSNLAETKKENYEFFYSPSTNLIGNAVDLFGYKTNAPYCFINNQYGIPSQDASTHGILVKMKLPTGGTIIYDYESNTYSKYIKGIDNIWHLDLDPNSYYDLLASNPSIPLIPENFFMVNYGSTNPYPFNFTNTSTTFDFTVTGTTNKTLFFNLSGDEYTLPPRPHDTIGTPPRTYSPTFTLKRITGNYTIPHFSENGYYIDTKSGLCFNKMIELTPGNYRITISSENNLYNFGTVEIKSQELNPNPRKWFYGGGLRLKQIGFFDNDAPFNFYDPSYNSDYITQGYVPVKEKKYNYNFFGTSISSGYLVDTDFSIINQNNDEFGYNKMYFGGYKNITITDSQNNGREEYVFKDGLDIIDLNSINSGIIYENSKKGVLIAKNVYDSNSTLLSSVNYNYDFNCPETDGGLSSNYPYSTLSNSYPSVFTQNPSTPTVTSNLLEIGKLTQKTTIDYFGSQAKTVIEYFSYDDSFHLLKEHQSSNSLGQTLRTEYTYDTNNSPFSQNRIYEPSETKMFRGTELILSNKISYNNSWPSNQSFLPYTTEFAKSTASYQVKKHYNLYDEFGNLLEEELQNGIVTSYIWGYNKSYIVAKLDNISYANIPSSIINDIQSKTDALVLSENNILTALNALRNSSDVNLKKAMITTYTYIPLVGISTIIDPKGDKVTNEYDELGRLIRVRDKENNILSETQYNLINQN